MDAIALLRNQIQDVHSLTDRMLEGLTPEQLHWRPPGSAHPIGSTFAHMVLNEDWLVHTAFQGRPPLYESGWASSTGFSSPQPEGGAWEEWARTVEIDLSQLREYARAVYAATDAYVAALTPADLEREISFPGPQPRPRPLSQVLSGPLIRHHANHCGEIAALKGLQGLRGYPY